MKNRFVSKAKLLVFLFCLFAGWNAGSLYAKDFSQKLKWNSDPNVLEYKVEIQDSTGKIISSVITEENQVSLSLTEGNYKYKITAYDLLGREAVSTRWVSFEVLVANQPAIVHNQSLEALQEDGKTLEINLNIEDVTSESIAELVNIKNGTRIRGKLILAAAEGAPVAGLLASEKHKANKARFTDVPEGMWKLVITNPSGLSSESQSFEVRDVIREQKLAAQKAEEERLAREKAEAEEKARLEAERLAAEKAEQDRLAAEEAERQRQQELALAQQEEAAVEGEGAEEGEGEAELSEEELAELARRLYDRKFYLAAGGGISMTLYDDNFFKDYLDKKNMSWAATLQFGYLPIHTPRTRFGMEFNAMLTPFSYENEFYKMGINILTAHENIAWRVGTKNQKFCFQVKAGGGIAFVQETIDYFDNSENNKDDKTENFAYLSGGGGLSFIFSPFSMLMIELGADYYNLFIPDMNIGIVNPYLAIGLRF